MEVTEAIQKWRSIRKFQEMPVEDEKLKKLFEAARRAPSWENVQPWHFIVIESQEMKEKLAKLAFGQKFLTKAPVLIAACGNVDVWNKDNVKKALTELRDAKVLEVPDEVIDKAFLSNPVFTPALLGKEIVTARTLEQVTIAISFMLIEAINQGLGSCAVGAFGNEITKGQPELYEEVKKDLKIPDNFILLTLIAVGYPEKLPSPRPRKELESIVSAETFGNPIF